MHVKYVSIPLMHEKHVTSDTNPKTVASNDLQRSNINPQLYSLTHRGML